MSKQPNPTKPEPTQDDSELIESFPFGIGCTHKQGYGFCEKCKSRLASELAAVRDEAERGELAAIEQRDRAETAADKLAYSIAPVEVIGEHSNLNNPWENALERLQIFFNGNEAGEQEAHTAGAAEMVERCISFIESTRGLMWPDVRPHLLQNFKGFIPNPNYLAEMRAVVREECAAVFDDKEKIDRMIKAAVEQGINAHGSGHFQLVSSIKKRIWNMVIADRVRLIRSLDPNPDVLEGMKREAVKPYRHFLTSVKSRCEYAVDKPPNMQGLTMQTIYDDARALLKEGE